MGNRRFEMAEEWVGELKYRLRESIQSVGQRTRDWRKMNRTLETCETSNVYPCKCNRSFRRREEKEAKEVFELMMAENFLNLMEKH